ncbi:MAG: T9SS type A sorting domain-containing protein [bacterium]|nr:T9SS type A sorting domain-containing protein [bacterium]
MQYLGLIRGLYLCCLIMFSASAAYAGQTVTIDQGHNLAMSNLTGIIQDILPKETAYCHYLVKNTGNITDDIYLSSEVVSNTGGTWTTLLVADEITSSLLASPQPLTAGETLSFYAKIISPVAAISGSCTIRVSAVNSYFHEHGTGDGWPAQGDADVQQDVINIQLITPMLTIISTTPSDSSLVPIETLIEAIFNPDPARWNLMMSLQDESTGINVAGRVVLQGNRLSFIPDTPLAASRQYKAVISGSGFVHEWRFATMSTEVKIEPADEIQSIVNYPNPFNITTDKYTAFSPLSINEDVVVEIYTLDGSLVQTLTYQNGTCLWNGQKNKNEDKVSSGIYIYIVKMKEQRKIGRMTVVR